MLVYQRVIAKIIPNDAKDNTCPSCFNGQGCVGSGDVASETVDLRTQHKSPLLTYTEAGKVMGESWLTLGQTSSMFHGPFKRPGFFEMMIYPPLVKHGN